MRLLSVLAMLPLIACSGHSDATDSAATGGSGEPAAVQGTGTSRSYDVTGFDQVDLRGSDDVDVRVGGAFAIQATGPAELLDKLEITKDGSTLKVGRRGNSFSWGGGEGREVKVMVTMPAIRGASISGSGDLSVDRVEGDDFAASAAGSGDLKVGTIKTKSAHFSVAGSGSITAAGTTGDVKMNIAGSGDIDAEHLTASTGDISMQGSGDIDATINGTAKVSMMGSGDVEVRGGAKCDVSKMGSGDVRCG
ncbi:MAG TPA: head GIN domain-containing protein [Sphingomonas sp.]|nr:head GIN domain-containing protein [Sphingomonas sp.]